jgi:hypothetical protein
MFLYLWFAIAMAAVFYLAVPLWGAFRARAAWKGVRDRISRLSSVPRLRYRDYSRASGNIGERRFFGTVDAFEGADVLWVSDGTQLAKVRLAGGSAFFLEGSEGDEEGVMRKVDWRSVVSLEGGTRVFVGGEVSAAGSTAEFGLEREPLVIFHDLEDSKVTEVATRRARHPNEYWNDFTQVSMIAGFAGMGLLMFFAFNTGILPSVAMLAMEVACLPILPLAPPGLALLMAYRVLWRRARAWRAERDAILLLWRHFEGNAAAMVYARMEGGGRTELVRTRLPDGTDYAYARGLPEGAIPPGVAPFADLEDAAESRLGAFGRPVELPDGSVRLVDSGDPSAPFLSLRGEPMARASAAARHAATYARYAVGLLAFGIAMNFIIAFAIFRLMTG